MFDFGFKTKKETARIRHEMALDKIDRARENFVTTISSQAGVNNIDTSSPMYQESLKRGNRLIDETKINENELFNNTLSAIDSESDRWWLSQIMAGMGLAVGAFGGKSGGGRQ